MAVGVLVSLQWLDAIDRIVDVYFFEGQRQDVTVGFGEAALTERRGLARLPGVLAAEPTRSVAARLRSGRARARGAVQGVRRTRALARLRRAAAALDLRLTAW